MERGNSSLPFDLQIIGLHKNNEREGKVRDPAVPLGDFLLGGVSNPRCSNETSSAQTKGGKKDKQTAIRAADVTPNAGHECQREQIQTR